MNFFICNRYDSKNEDIYIITPNIPLDNYKVYYYKKDDVTNLNIEKLHQFENDENNKINTSQNNEDSEELQIIDYPYPSHQTHNNLNSFYSNNSNKSKISNSFLDNNNKFFNSSNNNNESFYEHKIIKDLNERKHSFSCFTNSILEKTINNNSNNNKLYSENSDNDIEDTIKGEDNINISKLKMRKNLIIKKKNK